MSTSEDIGLERIALQALADKAGMKPESIEAFITIMERNRIRSTSLLRATERIAIALESMLETMLANQVKMEAEIAEQKEMMKMQDPRHAR